MSPAANSTSRWCPTPEQVMILEEMYRTGIRTPNASEIQHITSHLSFYGKIEGKNVFYWFQNHKARDRQKLKRKLFKQLHHQQQQPLFQHNSHVLGSSFQSPTTTSFQHFSCFNSSTGHLHLQGNEVVEDESNQLLNFKKLEIPLEKLEMNNSNFSMRLCGRDCMMMMEGMNHSHHLLTEAACSSNINNNNNNNNRTLKTLELFPVTATNLKEESTATIAMSNSLHACSSHLFNN